MNEEQWLAGTDFYDMLQYLHQQGKMRKLRLFAVACCRRLDHLPVVKRARTAVDLAERFADGVVAKAGMLEASKAAWAAARWTRDAARTANVAASGASAAFDDVDDLYGLANAATKSEGLYEPQRAAQFELFREIFGNPFRPVAIDPSWRTGASLKLAQAAYDERALPSGEMDPGCLAALSDALEEAGCTDAAILSHLRSPGPHVRGCWPVDLVLAKE